MWLLSTTAMLILQLLWPSVGHSLYKTILFMIQTWSSYRCPRAGDLTASVREHLSGARLPWRQQRWRLSIHQTWEPCPLSEHRIQCGISIADNGERDKLTENWKWILKCKWWAFYFFLGIVTNAMPSEEMFNMWGDSPCLHCNTPPMHPLRADTAKPEGLYSISRPVHVASGGLPLLPQPLLPQPPLSQPPLAQPPLPQPPLPQPPLAQPPLPGEHNWPGLVHIHPSALV